MCKKTGDLAHPARRTVKESEDVSQVQAEAVHIKVCIADYLECRPPVQSQCQGYGLEAVFESSLERYPERERIPYPGEGSESHVIIEVIVPKAAEQEII